jgi:Flp pilus assembly protein TadD
VRKNRPTAGNQALYGRALAAAGHRDDARRALEKSLELDPRQPEIRRLLDGLARQAP